MKDSTIPQAGKGAFSRRHLKKGSLILTSPTLPSPIDFLSLDDTVAEFPINSFQLLYNYQYGHKNSSLFLLPLNQVTAINHNSKRKMSGKEPNARVEFSSTEKKSMYFQSLPLEDLKKVRRKIDM